jgi:hypothetical protein
MQPLGNRLQWLWATPITRDEYEEQGEPGARLPPLRFIHAYQFERILYAGGNANAAERHNSEGKGVIVQQHRRVW